MKIVEREGGWLLIDEGAPEDANVIAVLRTVVEVVAIKTFCERFLTGQLPGPYSIQHGRTTYTVTPFQDREGKLSLKVVGADGSLGRVETEFVLDPPTAE